MHGHASMMRAAVGPRETRHRTIAAMARVVAIACHPHPAPGGPVFVALPDDQGAPEIFSVPVWFTYDRVAASIAQHVVTA